MSACTLNLTTLDENAPLHFHFNVVQGRLNIAWHLAISFFWICVFLRKCVYIVIKDSVLKISLQTLKYILLFMQDRGGANYYNL